MSELLADRETERMLAEQPLFASAHAALTFAFNYAPGQYAPSVMAKLIRGNVIGRGKGLVGTDGAGQAGMILCEVHGLGPSAENFLAARFAPHALPCECRKACCSGYRASPGFSEAVLWITHAAIEQLEGHMINYRLRRGLVLRYFGERDNMTELAKFAGVSRDMASQHNARLLPWLKQQEGAATHAIVAALKAAGITE